jgi:putative tricarboxylic transport membrane protein
MSSDGGELPLPACGERVGVWGSLNQATRREPPSPARLRPPGHSASKTRVNALVGGRPLSASGESASKTPERFGTGAPEGVIAPEAANNSAISASLAPALMLGIPGGATTALLLVALTVHGIRPGTLLFSNQPGLVYGFLVGLLFGAVMFLVVSVLCARLLAMVTLVRAELLAPIFLVISFAGVFAQDQKFSDIVVAVLFGLLGCAAQMFGFPTVPLVLGLVLGKLLETSFYQSLAISGGDWTVFFTRPLSAILIATALLIIVLPMLKRAVAAGRLRFMPRSENAG